MTTTATAQSTPLGEKTFTAQDQVEFADESRDRNPMHVDAVAARRLLSGRPVVHGIHTLIHALNLCQPPLGAGQLRVACDFVQPINVGDHVVFDQTAQADGCITVSASVEGLVCTQLTIDRIPPDQVDAVGRPSFDANLPVHSLGGLTVPLEDAPGSQRGKVIELNDWGHGLAARFSEAAALLGADGLRAVARLSYFVGMVCPGLHSVFSSVKFALNGDRSGSLRFEVTKYDPRFRLFIVAFDGVISGELRAFLRPPPQVQPSAQMVAERLHGNEFKDTRSLVIGGSRGLGEVTAKIIAGGGGDVVISYANGRTDAETVASDINGNGRGHCELTQIDLTASQSTALAIDSAGLDAIYYFATPRIYTKRRDLFNRTAFDGFVGIYLDAFYHLCHGLDRVERPRPLKIYLPSSVYVSERPRGMTEYAMAKAAAEILADDINRTLRNVTVVCTRLPRLATDQTAAILNQSVESNFEVMLDVVNEVSGSHD